MAEQSWRTGIYLTADVIQQHPNYVLRLRDEIGLDTVVIPFTGELPADVLSLSPYGGRTPTDAELDQLVSRHFDGRPIEIGRAHV